VPSSSPYPTSSPVGYPAQTVTSSSKVQDVTTTITSKFDISSYKMQTNKSIATYVDVCPTGFTTIVTTITKTRCPACEAAPTPSGVPEGWYTTVTVCDHCGPALTTVTLTKPLDHQTELYPTPQATGETYVPTNPEGETYVPGMPNKEAAAPEQPEGQKTEHATSTVVQVITLTKVPVPYTPAPYAPANGTVVNTPTGAASSTGYGSYPTYTPPQFEGAATRFGVGMSTLVLLMAGLLAL
jgi:chitinase